MRIYLPALSICLTAGAALHAAELLPADHAQRMARGLETFQKDIAPLLKTHCLKCHGAEATKGDFDMATRVDLLRGSHNGPVVVAFDAAKSMLIEVVSHTKEPNMPKDKPKLPAEAIAKLTSWINDGAPYAEPLIAGRKPKRDPSKVTDEDRQWWSFLPLKKAKALSAMQGASKIDEMLLAKAKPKGFTFSAPADPATLVRRMYLDLTGIPPTPEELATIVRGGVVRSGEVRGEKTSDAKASPLLNVSTSQPSVAPQALESLVDKLLASPRFGERWARHWLDVARFAESTGFEQDYDRPFAFHYRDFGNLATIGRMAAIVHFGRLKLSGLLAWWFWLSAHVFFLIGFRNRLVVLLNWAWAYWSYQRGARIILRMDDDRTRSTRQE